MLFWMNVIEFDYTLSSNLRLIYSTDCSWTWLVRSGCFLTTYCMGHLGFDVSCPGVVVVLDEPVDRFFKG
jgi:hypothetical protein